MFKSDMLKRPNGQSIFLIFIVALAAYFGAEASPLIGYSLAVLTILLIVFGSNSIWPTIKKNKNPVVFPLFWGLIIGLLVPYIIIKISNEGVFSIVNLMSTQK